MPQIPLPQTLRQQISGFRKNLFIQESILAGASLLAGLAFSFIFLFLFDRFFETPSFLRFFLLILGLAIVTVAFWFWLRNWIVFPRDDRRLSKIVQKHHKRLGDNLLGAIELAEGKVIDDSISPTLRQAAIESVSSQSLKYNFNKAINWKKALTCVAVFFVAAILLVTIFFFVRTGFDVTFARWLNPFSSVERYTFTQLNPLESPKIVASGEPFTVQCSLAQESQVRPESLTYQIGMTLPGTTLFNNNIAEIHLDGQSEKTVLNVEAFDCQKSMIVQPENRPALRSLKAKITFPDYLQQKPIEIEKLSSNLTVLDGSKIELTATISRDLKTAKANQKNVMTQKDQLFVPAFIAKNNDRISLSWIDIFNLSANPYELKIKTKSDDQPFVDCPKTASATALLVDDSLNVAIKSIDDFGISLIGANWSFAPVKEPEKKSPVVRRIITEGAPGKTELSTEFPFCPQILGIPEGSYVTFHVFTSDYYPQRGDVPSAKPRYFKVISHTEHLEMIAAEMQNLLTKIDNITQNEQLNKESNENIVKADDKKLMDHQSTEDIKEATNKEDLNANELKEVTENIDNLMKEAMKNKNFPTDTLKKWSDVLNQMKQIATEQMPQAAQNMEDAGGKQSAEERRKEMEEAIKKQEEIIKKLQKESKKLDDSLKNMDADTFVKRLENAAKIESELSQKVITLLPKMIGMDPKSMSKTLYEEYEFIKNHQLNVKTEATNINSDLRAYYQRTHNEMYNKCADAMDKENFQNRLELLNNNIENNKMVQTGAHLEQMSKFFEEWAEMLKKDSNESKGQNQQQEGQNKQQQIPKEALLELLRMAQEEKLIREETRALQVLKEIAEDNLDAGDANAISPDSPTFKKSAEQLGQRQNALSKRLIKLEEKYFSKEQQLKQLAASIQSPMIDAKAKLFNNETEGETIAAETEALEKIGELFGQSNKKNQKKNPQQAQQMQQMMQQIMKQGKTGTMPGKGQQGDGFASGAPGPGTEMGERDRRDGDTATGKIPGYIPPEFRDAIESFHLKVDKFQSAQ